MLFVTLAMLPQHHDVLALGDMTVYVHTSFHLDSPFPNSRRDTNLRLPGIPGKKIKCLACKRT